VTDSARNTQTAAIQATFRDVAANMSRIASHSYIEAVERAVDLLEEAFRAGRKLLVFGNGGSSADAQHLTAELVGRFVKERPGLPAIALTTNQAIITAWSNDYSFDTLFSRQVQALGVAGDVAFGITTSGKSPNVVEGLRQARAQGLRTILVTRDAPGAVESVCDVVLGVPLTETARIQEVHLVTYHAICAALDERMLGGDA
jgi:D-sedoheptulose 7-phosphate isomerase